MQQATHTLLNKFYLSTILILMLILPVLSTVLDPGPGDWVSIAGRWFLFWGIGGRLFTAGMRQAFKPEFTAVEIFHIDDPKSASIVRELGFANICMGSAAILTFFIPGWRMAAAFTGGLYMGIAGIYHIIKKPAGINEMIAMISDIFIFLVMAVYIASANNLL